MEEIWKDIIGFEGLYQISNLGRVKSLGRYVTKERFLKEAKSKTYILSQFGRVTRLSTYTLLISHFKKEEIISKNYLPLKIPTLHGEEWKIIKDYESYMVSSYGRVKSINRDIVYRDGSICWNNT